jgi:hypothetical protein
MEDLDADAQAALKAGIAKVLGAAVEYAIRKPRVSWGKPPPVHLLRVVADGAVAAVQAAPNGGTLQLREAARHALNAVGDPVDTAGIVRAFQLTQPLFWLKQGLVPPEVDGSMFVWPALLSAPLVLMTQALNGKALPPSPRVSRKVYVGGQAVWAWYLDDPGPSTRPGWVALGGASGCRGLSFTYPPPPWDRQGFTRGEWAVMWRYLACWSMFDGGPLTATVAAVRHDCRTPQEMWAALVQGTANPTWATLQEVGDWTLYYWKFVDSDVPLWRWWVFIAAGYRPRKYRGEGNRHRFTLGAHAVHCLVDRTRCADGFPKPFDDSPVRRAFPGTTLYGNTRAARAAWAMAR